jgi:formylglycine-generating enzyme required for sulfatase activity
VCSSDLGFSGEGKKAAEEKQHLDAKEKQRLEAEEKGQREADEKARQEGAEQARHDADERKRRESEEKARQEAEEQRRLEAGRRKTAGTIRRDGERLMVLLAEGVELELVRIPAGAFLMGSDKAKDKAAYDNELPQHKVNLGEYWMGKYPLTNAQYRCFTRAAGYFTSAKEDHPVVYVSWDEAVQYCQWLSQMTGKAFRLPSEAEWEKAARGTDGRLYPWGNEISTYNRCNFDVKDITPVGKYSPQGDSPYGCADMAGNVWEWTHSLLKPYPYRADDGREDEGNRWGRVLRGGSFINHQKSGRCASRDRYDSVARYQYCGFRVSASSIFNSEL